MHHYNLLHQSWLPVILNHRPVTMSLLDVFTHADHIQRLDLADPLERQAISRLLDAITRRALHGRTGDDILHQPYNPTPILDYLHDQTSRFDLMDPDHPFLQTPHLQPQNPNIRYGLTRLRARNQRPLWWDTNPYQPISPAQAARWLITCHNYDVAGIHTGMIGDPDTRGGKSPGRGVAAAGQLLTARITGPTLRHTLLLNLTPGPDNDPPIWELDPPTIDRSRHFNATGPAIAATWPSRLIRLDWTDDGRCATAHVTNGERSIWDPKTSHGPQAGPRCEPSAVWTIRHNRPQPDTCSTTPVIDRPLWTMWDRIMTPDHRPAGIDHAARLQHRLHITWTGVEYGPQSSTIASIRNDTMILDTSRLDDPDTTTLINRLIRQAWPAYRKGDDPTDVWAAGTRIISQHLQGENPA